MRDFWGMVAANLRRNWPMWLLGVAIVAMLVAMALWGPSGWTSFDSN